MTMTERFAESEKVVLCSDCRRVVRKVATTDDPQESYFVWHHADDNTSICCNAMAVHYQNADHAAVVQLREERKRLTDLLLDQDGNLKQGAELRKAQAEVRRQARNISARIWRRRSKDHRAKRERGHVRSV